MAEPSLGFRLIWADYSGYVEGARRLLKRGQKRAALPATHSETFATKAEAEAAQARLRATGGDALVSSVLPVVVKVPEPGPALLGDLPAMAKRLTP